jgi:D-alanine transaminase
MSEIVYLNGEFMPLENARIPVLDRGFIFGDGVYEVIPVYSRHPFRLQEHLVRFSRSHDAIGLDYPMKDAEWTRLVHELVSRNGNEDQSVYLQVTRGVAKRDHAFPKDVRQTVFGMSSPMTSPSRQAVENGIATISAVDYRWLKCDVKSTSLLANCMLRQMAADAGATEVVMFRDGFLTEGSSSNVFVVKNGTILAPPKNNLVLPGITYDVVLELAQTNGVPHQVRSISQQEVRDADEIWVTSSTKEVLAATALDAKPVGDGKPGPVFRRMHQLYQDFKRTVMRQAA